MSNRLVLFIYFKIYHYLYKILHQQAVEHLRSTNQYCCSISQEVFVMQLVFGEPRSSCNFVKETPLCRLLPNVLLGQLLLSAASLKKLLQRCRVVFSPLSNMYDISFL